MVDIVCHYVADHMGIKIQKGVCLWLHVLPSSNKVYIYINMNMLMYIYICVYIYIYIPVGVLKITIVIFHINKAKMW